MDEDNGGVAPGFRREYEWCGSCGDVRKHDASGVCPGPTAGGPGKVTIHRSAGPYATNGPIKAHALARMLLDGPDEMVVVPAGAVHEAPVQPPIVGSVQGEGGYYPAVFLLPVAGELPDFGPGSPGRPVPPWRHGISDAAV